MTPNPLGLPLGSLTSFDQIDELIEGLDPITAQALLDDLDENSRARSLPASPLEQALELDPEFTERDHLTYLSQRVAQAVKDVENGQSRFLAVSMPPRMGKTTLATFYTPLWILRQHPDWPIALISHDGGLVTSWGRQIRREVENHSLGIEIAKDAGAVTEWETTAGGSVLSRTWRGPLTGRGVKVLLVDDPVKDAADASSLKTREAIWEWWQSVAQTRFEPPVLVIVVMTRWHEDDLTGRLLSTEHPGDPDDWEVISFPAVAEQNDVLGREPGEPLLSPLLDETPEQALARWETTRRNVGSYTWSALYQQRPAPAEGAIFNADWWQFWVSPEHSHLADGRENVSVLDLAEKAARAQWVDSWDMAFKGGDSSDFVVGQRWAKIEANRYLIHQERARLSFTESVARLKAWDSPAAPFHEFVHRRLVEDKANGTAIIDTLKSTIAGLIPVNPTNSKEARARSVTPEIESGNVFLPHPAMPGYGWVNDLLSELRSFPKDVADDQVDSLTQALTDLRDHGGGGISVPRVFAPSGRNLPGVARGRAVR